MRLKYFILILTIIITGLYTRSNYMLEVEFLKEYAGDTLWAMMVFFLFKSIFIKTPQFRIAILSLAFCYSIEVSQLYHAPWIDAIRSNKFAALILGFGFKYTDLVCYTIGILFATLINAQIGKLTKSPQPTS